MIDFILSNFQTVAGLVLAIILIIYAIFTRQWSLLQLAAYRLMLSAEWLMATRPGKTKMNVVYEEIWSLMPVWFKLFVNEITLKQKLQEWYDLAKDYTDDGTINQSIQTTK